MGYCAAGSMSNADWIAIKKLCAKMRKDIDKELDTLEEKLESEIAALDTGKIQTILNSVNALSIQVQSLVDGQVLQDTRLDKLEEVCANTEITTSEVLEAYNG